MPGDAASEAQGECANSAADVRTALSDVTPLGVLRADLEQRMAPLDLAQLEGEARRELALREGHYPKAIERGRLERRHASRQLALQREIVNVLAVLRGA